MRKTAGPSREGCASLGHQHYGKLNHMRRPRQLRPPRPVSPSHPRVRSSSSSSPAAQSTDLDEPDPFFGGQRIERLFATDVTQISRLNMTPSWGEAMRYLDQALSHWAAEGMPSDGFFENVEQKMHSRFGAPLSPQSLSMHGGGRP